MEFSFVSSFVGVVELSRFVVDSGLCVVVVKFCSSLSFMQAQSHADEQTP